MYCSICFHDPLSVRIFLHQAQIGIIPRRVLSSCSCCANSALRSLASAAARLRDWNTISQIVTITMERVAKNTHLSTGPGGDRMPPTIMLREPKAPARSEEGRVGKEC